MLSTFSYFSTARNTQDKFVLFLIVYLQSLYVVTLSIFFT